MTRGQPFDFASEARPILPRSKYRPESHGVDPQQETDTEDWTKFSSIQYDPRVCRGSTFATKPLMSAFADEPGRGLAAASAGGGGNGNSRRRGRKGGGTSSRSQRKLTAEMIYDAQYGHTNQGEVDLSAHLVEGKSSPGWGLAGETKTGESQTDDFEERPPSPAFVPRKTGIDAETQIHDAGGDSDELFDFDQEVQPLLDVLVGKTIEQSKLEVEQERELAEIRIAADVLAAQQQLEELEVRQMEAAAVKGYKEKEERRLAKRKEAYARDCVCRKVAGMALFRQIWPSTVEGAGVTLFQAGTWETPTGEQVRRTFLPWLMQNVTKQSEGKGVGRQVVCALLESVEERAAHEEAECVTQRRAYAAMKHRLEREARERSAVIRLFLDPETLGLPQETAVGPLEVLGGDTLEEAEAKLVTYLDEAGLEVDPNLSGPHAVRLLGLYVPVARKCDKMMDIQRSLTKQQTEKEGELHLRGGKSQ